MAEAIGNTIAGAIGLYIFLAIIGIVVNIAAVICIFITCYRTRLMSMNMYTLYQQNEELLEIVKNVEVNRSKNQSENSTQTIPPEE